MTKLKDNIEDDGMLVTKEYVKGRENIYSNPAVKEYTRISDSANKTVSTLLKLITKLKSLSTEDDYDPFMDILSGKIKI